MEAGTVRSRPAPPPITAPLLVKSTFRGVYNSITRVVTQKVSTDLDVGRRPELKSDEFCGVTTLVNQLLAAARPRHKSVVGQHHQFTTMMEEGPSKAEPGAYIPSLPRSVVLRRLPLMLVMVAPLMLVMVARERRHQTAAGGR